VAKALNAISKFRNIWSLRPNITHNTLLKSTLLILILAIAFLIRILPVRWGYFLNEFDPYQQYRQTKYIIENGLWGPNGWISWHDYMSWYPWGNSISIHHYPGLPVLGAALYMVLSTLGVPFVSSPILEPLLSDPIYIFCVIFPATMAVLASLAIYFLGKDIGGESVGMFAALFLALDPSYISRTALGFYDDESVGVLTLILVSLFFLRSIEKEKPLKFRLIYAIATGLCLAYLSASWGAARYPIVMIALFAFCLLIVGRYSTGLFLSSIIVFSIALPISATVPRLGFSFLFEEEILPVYGVLFLLFVAEVNQRTKTKGNRTFYFIGLFCLLIAALVFLWWSGSIKALGTKFLAVLSPFTRFESTIFESVAEHRPSAWGTFYYNWGIGVFFLIAGIFFAVMSATDAGIFMVIFGITSVYFASSMIRITIMISPVMSLLWALAIVRLMKPFILFLKEPSESAKRKMRFRSVIGKETAAGIIILMYVFLIITFVIGSDFMIPSATREGSRVYSQSYTPTTIAAAGMSIGTISDTDRDWLNALTWMHESLPPSTPLNSSNPGTVVASWWDYGYWITTIANRTSLADNGTWNTTQIQQIGTMFMSNETESIKILKQYNVTHVVVFVTFTVQTDSSTGYQYPAFVNLGGDNAKWQWMARIPGPSSPWGGDDTVFGNYSLGVDWKGDLNKNGQADSSELVINTRGQNSTLYKLMNYGAQMTVWSISTVNLQYFEEAYFSQPHGSPNPASGTSYIPMVCVYKVKYPQNNTQTS
jgi:dolichyl-diphosphooligosaccharide--protein glycosyltransferase